MGTPRRQRRKFSRPTHPWRLDRITREKELCTKYGLKNRREIWTASSTLRRMRQQARKLLASSNEVANLEVSQLIAKLNSWGIKTSTLDDILALNVENLLELRLQTIVQRKGIANTIGQARQLVTHNHIYVKNRKVNIPSYMVLASEEDTVRLAEDMKVEKGGGEEVKEAAS